MVIAQKNRLEVLKKPKKKKSLQKNLNRAFFDAKYIIASVAWQNVTPRLPKRKDYLDGHGWRYKEREGIGKKEDRTYIPREYIEGLYLRHDEARRKN